MRVTFLRGTKAPLVKGSWPEGPEGLARRGEKLPFQGSWQPKADGEVVTNLLHNLSVSAFRRATSPGRGGFGICAPQRLPL